MRDPNEICQEIEFLAENYLNLKEWKFKETGKLIDDGDNKTPTIVYQSDICKLKISFKEWHPPYQNTEYTINVHYGRSIAEDNKNIISFNNENCHCWHGIIKPLHFLDGHTPEYTAQNLFTHEIVKEYKKKWSPDSFSLKHPEWEIRKHAFIWNTYKYKLFDLFNLQNQDSWNKYRLFLKDIYDIEGRHPAITPPMDQVC